MSGVVNRRLILSRYVDILCLVHVFYPAQHENVHQSRVFSEQTLFPTRTVCLFVCLSITANAQSIIVKRRGTCCTVCYISTKLLAMK